MLDVVRRLEDDLQPLEDDLQTTEDDLDILEVDQFFCFLQINKDSLNPFKCSEMILNYKGKMINEEVNRMEGDLQTTEHDLCAWTTEDDPPSN